MSEDEIRKEFEEICTLLSNNSRRIPLERNSIDDEYELMPVQYAWEKFLAVAIRALKHTPESKDE